ncbi:peptidase family C78-domain-containing protein [Mycena metata]|uniref:Peptidase family C78-domain-containing protein n=1 Tax=Mycena metata TaxID=1033252 RepID=A0AAD7JTW7_9AGAR|nr:peptidase family C78-domain-containing protein [Mycena metata]
MSYTLSGGRIDTKKTKTPQGVQCQLCFTNLDALSLPQREQHYDKHFSSEQPIASTSSSKQPPTNDRDESRSPGKSWKDWLVPKGQDKFWYPSQTLPPPNNFTPGLIPLLKTHLNKSHSAGNTRRAVLCYDRSVLVTREVWDASWGCGYRNFLMACTALMDQQIQPMYFPLLDDPISPSVRNLQQWIEDAWKVGFDPDGKEQLKQLVGSKKWIGASDIQCAFTSRGIPSKLVDFDLQKNARGADLLTDWVIEYFSKPHGSVDTRKVTHNTQPRTINDALLGASAVTVTSRMPMILQHAGHSRTIVGYEVSKTGLVNLLVFDPSRLPNKRLRQEGLDAFSSMNARRNAPLNNAAASSSNAGPSCGKRPATASSLTASSPPLKRSRLDNRDGNAHAEQEDDDDDVVIICDSRDQNLPGRGSGKMTSPKNDNKKDDKQQLPTRDILQFFRLDPKKLEKKKAYQILYFPVSEPLSEQEKIRARGLNVYGEKIS